MSHEVADAQRMITEVVRSMVDNPEAVTVEAFEQNERIVLSLRVAQSDLPGVIGRNGRTARSLRTILSTCGAKGGRLYVLEIADRN